MSVKQNMAMVLQAFKNAGLSDNQARILAAEVGRENAFQDKWLWGRHTDPANKVTNVGMISWQGKRGRGVEQALNNAGLIKDGKIIKGQASLDVMARYMINEMRTDPTYAATRKQFLENPNVDYQTGTRVLGKNFIRWRYDDPKYASGHRNRDKFYAQLGGITPTAETATQDTPTASNTGQGTLLDAVVPAFSPITAAGKAAQAATAILQGGVGLAVPETPTQNRLFSKIADMGLGMGIESIYAEAASAIANALDRISGRPMLQSTDPLRSELSDLFDEIDI